MSLGDISWYLILAQFLLIIFVIPSEDHVFIIHIFCSLFTNLFCLFCCFELLTKVLFQNSEEEDRHTDSNSTTNSTTTTMATRTNNPVCEGVIEGFGPCIASSVRDSVVSTPVEAMSTGTSECPQGGKRRSECESPSVAKNARTDNTKIKGGPAAGTPPTPGPVMQTMPDNRNDKTTDDGLDQNTAERKRKITMEVLDSSVKVTICPSVGTRIETIRTMPKTLSSYLKDKLYVLVTLLHHTVTGLEHISYKCMLDMMLFSDVFIEILNKIDDALDESKETVLFDCISECQCYNDTCTYLQPIYQMNDQKILKFLRTEDMVNLLNRLDILGITRPAFSNKQNRHLCDPSDSKFQESLLQLSEKIKTPIFVRTDRPKSVSDRRPDKLRDWFLYERPTPSLVNKDKYEQIYRHLTDAHDEIPGECLDASVEASIDIKDAARLQNEEGERLRENISDSRYEIYEAALGTVTDTLIILPNQKCFDKEKNRNKNKIINTITDLISKKLYHDTAARILKKETEIITKTLVETLGDEYIPLQKLDKTTDVLLTQTPTSEREKTTLLWEEVKRLEAILDKEYGEYAPPGVVNAIDAEGGKEEEEMGCSLSKILPAEALDFVLDYVLSLTQRITEAIKARKVERFKQRQLAHQEHTPDFFVFENQDGTPLDISQTVVNHIDVNPITSGASFTTQHAAPPPYSTPARDSIIQKPLMPLEDASPTNDASVEQGNSTSATNDANSTNATNGSAERISEVSTVNYIDALETPRKRDEGEYIFEPCIMTRSDLKFLYHNTGAAWLPYIPQVCTSGTGYNFRNIYHNSSKNKKTLAQYIMSKALNLTSHLKTVEERKKFRIKPHEKECICDTCLEPGFLSVPDADAYLNQFDEIWFLIPNIDRRHVSMACKYQPSQICRIQRSNMQPVYICYFLSTLQIDLNYTLPVADQTHVTIDQTPPFTKIYQNLNKNLERLERDFPGPLASIVNKDRVLEDIKTNVTEIKNSKFYKAEHAYCKPEHCNNTADCIYDGLPKQLDIKIAQLTQSGWHSEVTEFRLLNESSRVFHEAYIKTYTPRNFEMASTE